MKPVTMQILLEKSTVEVFGYRNANTFLEEWKVPKKMKFDMHLTSVQAKEVIHQNTEGSRYQDCFYFKVEINW